jgi:carotenoid cleavage dioxygenase
MNSIDEMWAGVTEPYLQGQFEPVHDERDDTRLEVIGELPDALRGVYMRNGANAFFPPPGRYHPFDGDGMIHAVELDGEGGASYRNRWVRSRGLEYERTVGHAVYGGLSEYVVPPDDALQRGGFIKNTANTSIVRHGGRYLALMEGAHPTEVTRELETVGEHDFDGRLAGAMTAHPRLDPDTGELLIFGYSPFPPFLRYHVISPTGELTRSTEVPIGRSVMMHDFVTTPNHVLFFDMPALFDLQALMGGGTSIRWQPESGGRIGVMPRDGEGEDIRWIEVEPFYVFHFMNAYEDGEGGIVVDGCRSVAMPTSFGEDPPPEQHVRPLLWQWRIDPAAGTVEDRQLDDRTGDFPRINDTRNGKPYRFGAHAHTGDWEQGLDVRFDGIILFDHDRGTSEQHVYGPHSVSGEAVFAPDPAGEAEDDGWWIHFVTDMAEDRTELVLLDARDITAGPVARVVMPRRLPFGFHGNWMPDL